MMTSWRWRMLGGVEGGEHVAVQPALSGAHLAACATTGRCSSGGFSGRLLKGEGRTMQQQKRRLVKS